MKPAIACLALLALHALHRPASAEPPAAAAAAAGAAPPTTAPVAAAPAPADAAASALAPAPAPASAAAVAAGLAAPLPGSLKPLWELGLGVGALRLPDYRGSDQSRTRWFPVPYAVYRGRFLRADREGARAVLFDARSVEVDLSLAASPPTRSRDNAARAGMPDLKAAVEFGPNVNLTLLRSDDRMLKLDVRLPLRAAFSVERSPARIGTTFTPNLNLDVQGLAGGWNLGLLAGPIFADRRYHDRVYGVAPAYATPQRSAYAAPGGYSGWQSLASVSRRFDSAWLGGFVRHDSLHGAAFAESPLLRRKAAWTFGFGVSWVLRSSAELVPATE